VTGDGKKQRRSSDSVCVVCVGCDVVSVLGGSLAEKLLPSSVVCVTQGLS
jgi:hypothetical protein